MDRTGAGAPRRVLTDWTTMAGVDGTGLLALVTGGATAEGIHLATLGYEVFVLHSDQAGVDAAESAAHVHPVVASTAALPDQWSERFDLVVALDGDLPADAVAPQGIALVVATAAVEVIGFTRVVTEQVSDGESRTVLVKLEGSP